jgi:hypothetical protein
MASSANGAVTEDGMAAEDRATAISMRMGMASSAVRAEGDVSAHEGAGARANSTSDTMRDIAECLLDP